MSFKEIVDRIVGKFGDEAVISSHEEAIQPFVILKTNLLLEVCTELQTDPDLYFDHLSNVTGVDNGVEKNTMEVVYHFYSITKNIHFIIKVVLDRQKPVVPSLTSIWRTADWHERETFDFFGIHFEGHPDLRRILLPANWEGHPLRKDYTTQEYFHGVKVDYE